MEKLSETKRVLYVFTKPYQAMLDIGKKPGYLVPIMCMLIFPLLTVIVNIGYYQQQLMIAMAAQLQKSGITMDINSLVRTQLYATIGLTPVQTLIAWIIFSLAVYLLSQMFGGDEEITFKTVLSIAGYAFLIKAVLYIISTVILYINPDALIQFSVHDLVKLFYQTENLYITALMQQLSVFKIWEYAVVGVGIYVNKQMAKGKAAAVMVIVFALQYALICVQLMMIPAAAAIA